MVPRGPLMVKNDNSCSERTIHDEKDPASLYSAMPDKHVVGKGEGRRK
jgi:hypothetical protein